MLSGEPKGTMCCPCDPARMPRAARKGAIVSLCERGPSVLTSTPTAPARWARSDWADDEGR